MQSNQNRVNWLTREAWLFTSSNKVIKSISKNSLARKEKLYILHKLNMTSRYHRLHLFWSQETTLLHIYHKNNMQLQDIIRTSKIKILIDQLSELQISKRGKIGHTLSMWLIWKDINWSLSSLTILDSSAMFWFLHFQIPWVCSMKKFVKTRDRPRSSSS